MPGCVGIREEQVHERDVGLELRHSGDCVARGARAPDDIDFRDFHEHGGQPGGNHLMIVDDENGDAAHVRDATTRRATAHGTIDTTVPTEEVQARLPTDTFVNHDRGVR